LIDRQSERRGEFEHFVHRVFAANYAAQVTQLMPQLIAVETNQIQAVLGVRSGTHNLFVEHYLEKSIEQYLTFQDSVSRSQILEIGNLVSINCRHTPRLFMLTALSAIDSGFRYFVFSATNHVAALLKSFNLPLTYLQDADGSKLGDKVNNWGSYYQTSPQVFALDLNHVFVLCQNNDLLVQLYSELVQQVVEL
jgi:hypothetical protein